MYLQPSGGRPYPPLPPQPQASLGLTPKYNFSRKSGMEGKWQVTDKFNLPKTSVANHSVVLETQQNKTFKSSASTTSPAVFGNLASISFPAERNSLLDPAPPDLILRTFLRAPTPPITVTPTPAPLVPSQSSPAPPPTPSPVPDSLKFVPGIEEALPYAVMAQETYPPPATTPRDDLTDTDKTTARKLHRVPSLLAFLASKQRKTLGNLHEVVKHLEAVLLHSYTEEGILVHTGPSWSSRALETAISKEPHSSACIPKTLRFV